MKINVLAFGASADIIGERAFSMDIELRSSINNLKMELVRLHPDLSDLSSVALAVNNEYVLDDHVLFDGDEVAIIPPVSGG
jgi:molybdopterin synthase sulfur carrier subunit